MRTTGRYFAAAVVAAGVLVGGGCRTAGPDFVAPTSDVTGGFKHAAAASAASATDVAANATPPVSASGVDAWWTIFGDPALGRLEEAALAQSPTLAAAAARVQEARARWGLARAETRMGVNASGAARLVGETAERTLEVPGRPITFRERGDSYRAAADASYELDLWGRVRRLVESAEAQLDASAADERAVKLALTAEVAQAYFAWRSLDAVSGVLAKTTESRRTALAVLRARFDAGLAAEIDATRAAVELVSLEAEWADLRRRREQALNALAVLTGAPPMTFATQLRPNADATDAVPPQIPAGLPSELLRRRPDLAASEALWHARTAEIGMAEAARFPAIRLTGSGGFESVELGSLLGRPSQFWQLGPSVTMPLLDGGRTRAHADVARARAAMAEADYRQRALTAFREVEDALVELREQAAQAAAQARAAEGAEAVRRLALVRYERGFATYLEVVDAERSALQIERARVELAGARQASTVRLIRALGGGWNEK